MKKQISGQRTSNKRFNISLNQEMNSKIQQMAKERVNLKADFPVETGTQNCE
jgi:hypothetical protein